MDITAANAILFFLTILLVTLIGWFVLKLNGKEESKTEGPVVQANKAKKKKQPSSSTNEPRRRSSDKKGAKVKVPKKENDKKEETNINVNKGPDGLSLSSFSSSIQEDSNVVLLHTSNEQLAPSAVTSANDDDTSEKEVVPVFMTLNSKDELESEIKAAADERQEPIHETQNSDTTSQEKSDSKDDTMAMDKRSSTPPTSDDNGEEWIVV